ncbi:hypothetical protein K1719_014633 [Acacia pycnantha]|nr:hypothetical protein K1719_014633 [Acacia pycnantha]
MKVNQLASQEPILRGVDLSDANVSVQIDLGRRSIASTSCSKSLLVSGDSAGCAPRAKVKLGIEVKPLTLVEDKGSSQRHRCRETSEYESSYKIIPVLEQFPCLLDSTF